MSQIAKQVLVFGGTFDPPHLAHTTLPPVVADRLECFRVLYVPARISPHKLASPPTADHHRLAMLAIALAEVPEAEICPIELQRDGPSYTVDTLESLRARFGAETGLRLLIGADQAVHFHAWKSWERILELATPAVMLRPPMDAATFGARLREAFDPDEAARWEAWTVTMPQLNIDATTIRQRLKAGDDTDGLLDPRVEDYIRRQGLYRA